MYVYLKYFLCYAKSWERDGGWCIGSRVYFIYSVLCKSMKFQFTKVHCLLRLPNFTFYWVFHGNTLWDRVLHVRLSVCFQDNSRTIRLRMMKLCTHIVEIKSNMELKDGMWMCMTFDTVKIKVLQRSLTVHIGLHSVHVHVHRNALCNRLVCPSVCLFSG